MATVIMVYWNKANFLDSLQPSKKKPEYWLTLGSSKSRTTEQGRLSGDLLRDNIGSCSTDTTVCFTDGSCLGNPGPCGAGACIFLPGAEEPVCLKKPVCLMWIHPCRRVSSYSDGN